MPRSKQPQKQVQSERVHKSAALDKIGLKSGQEDHFLLQLQRQVGNQGVIKMLQSQSPTVIGSNRRAAIIQRYPGTGSVPGSMAKRIDKALTKMSASDLEYEVNLAKAIKSGKYDVAYPDFFDQTLSPPEKMEISSALNRKASWEWEQITKKQLGQPTESEMSDMTAKVPATGAEMKITIGAEAQVLHHSHYDGVIYLLSSPGVGDLATLLLHEAMHADQPLTLDPKKDKAGSDKEIFLSEIRSYYYADFKNVADLEARFAKAVGKAEDDTNYLTQNSIPLTDVLRNRETWMREVGTP